MKNIGSANGQANGLRNLLSISAAAALGILAATPASAQTIEKTFEFGPGTPNDHSNMRTFAVPAFSHVLVRVDATNVTGAPLVIEVHKPDANSISFTGPDGPLIDIRTNFLFNELVLPSDPALGGTSGYIGDQFGCPSTWRIRVRTVNNLAPPVIVSGLIKFTFVAPLPSNVTMGTSQNVGPGLTATRSISGVTGKGTGTVRIKAKWHTDPLDLLHLDTFWPMTVRLIRPDGSIAASQTGFSQHAPSNFTPKINFTYFMTPTDLAMSGSWKVRMENNTGINLVGFNIESGGDPLVPTFTSTFTPGCN
jgi:hypothetical protein